MSNLRIMQTTVMAAFAVLIGLGAAGPAAGQADPNAPLVKDLLGNTDNLGLDWAKLFDANGRARDEVDAAGNPGSNGYPDYIDWYGGFDGCSVEDNISAGVAVDMSVMTGGPSLPECTVYNGTVGSVPDLGNSYVYATFDSVDNLVVYVGVERLNEGADTFLEIELNQDVVGVTGGVPWPMRGQRTANDVLLRIDYSLGVVSGVEVKSWVPGAGFQTVASYGGLESSPCNGEATYCLFCGGSPPIAAAQEVWDSAGNPVPATPPDDFLEIGVNIGRLLGVAVDYTAIQVKTAEDIALGTFRAMGHWGGV